MPQKRASRTKVCSIEGLQLAIILDVIRVRDGMALPASRWGTHTRGRHGQGTAWSSALLCKRPFDLMSCLATADPDREPPTRLSKHTIRCMHMNAVGTRISYLSSSRTSLSTQNENAHSFTLGQASPTRRSFRQHGAAEVPGRRGYSHTRPLRNTAIKKVQCVF